MDCAQPFLADVHNQQKLVIAKLQDAKLKKKRKKERKKERKKTVFAALSKYLHSCPLTVTYKGKTAPIQRLVKAVGHYYYYNYYYYY